MHFKSKTALDSSLINFLNKSLNILYALDPFF